MIELNNLTFFYQKNAPTVLRGINGQIDSGIYLLAGENGAGKTTLLHMISGVATPEQGMVLINGKNPSEDNVFSKGKTFLLEENTEIPMKTIRKFAESHSRFYPNFSEDRFNENLKAFGLSGDEPAKSLSLGSRKKSLLAYALSLGVNTLLLDEPTNALDIQSKEQLKTLIARNIEDDQTVIIATHTVTELENLFDGALMMKDGELLWSGTAQDITNRLMFVKTRYLDPSSLYAEQAIGYYNSILPIRENEKTLIDWKLLYTALHSVAGNNVINQLKH